MKVYLIEAPSGMGVYITSDLNNALIQRDVWAEKSLNEADIYPSSEEAMDLSEDDGVDLSIEDIKKRNEIKTLDSEKISHGERKEFIRRLSDNSKLIGDLQEIIEIKKAFMSEL